MSIEARPAEGRAPARIGWQDLLICGAALAALALPTPVGEAPELVRAVALVIFAIGYWATGRMPEHVVALVFFLAAMLLSVAPPQVIFAGFAAPAFWLVVGGLIIGGAVDHTGFGQRLARFMVGRAAGSYAKMIAAILVVDLALAFIMPSTMGRVALLLPIAMAIAGEAGFRPGQKGWNGIVLATVFGSYMGPTTILTANVPNNILLGAADSLHGIKITYFEYLGVHFPILGLLKTLILGLVIIVFWADRPGLAPTAKERQPWRPVERRIAIILAAALLLWMSDIWHGVTPAWISLTAGLALIAPGLGVLSGREFESCLKLRPLIYVAGIFGLGAIAADTGLGNFLARQLLTAFPLTPGADATNFGLLALGNVALGLITAMPSIPAVVAPLAGDLAAAMDVPVITVLMTTVLGFSTAIFPYQVPPLLLGLYMGKVPFREGVRLGATLAAITGLVLFPLDFLWWRWLGYFG